jgi:N-acetylmuramoyl-L-alanine amidase
MQRVDKPLLQTASNKVHRILIDCGHGGRDPGAVGVQNITEKDITMQVGQKLAHLLRKQGCDVFMTRDADLFVPLTTRTNTINVYRPDVFISIHANSSAQPVVQGIETYCLSSCIFSDFACSDNAGLQLKDLLQQRYAKSRKLADSVHKQLLSNLAPYDVCDRKIKYAGSQVLLGANAPGILVEVGFVSHAQEVLRLAQPAYQEQLAQGMCLGIMAYLSS